MATGGDSATEENPRGSGSALAQVDPSVITFRSLEERDANEDPEDLSKAKSSFANPTYGQEPVKIDPDMFAKVAIQTQEEKDKSNSKSFDNPAYNQEPLEREEVFPQLHSGDKGLENPLFDVLVSLCLLYTSPSPRD